jgi:hypothetical protein
MAVMIAGVVKDGVVIPSAPLPEGALVEIRISEAATDVSAVQLSASELRKMPCEQREANLTAAAELAEQDYLCDNELTGFDAFSEEERDDDVATPED